MKSAAGPTSTVAPPPPAESGPAPEVERRPWWAVHGPALGGYAVLHAAHYDLSHLEFLPFGLLALLRLYDAPNRRRALAFGALVGLTFLTNLYYFVFLLIACAVVAAWRWRDTLRREMALRFAQAGGLAAVLAA